VVALQGTEYEHSSTSDRVPVTCWVAPKEPEKAAPSVGGRENAWSTSGRLAATLTLTAPQSVGTSEAAKRVTAVPSAETTISTVPPVAADPV
jgi:hypothetical protein